MIKSLPKEFRHSLMSSDTSRPNKMHLFFGWTQLDGYWIEYKWKGEPLKSRIMFRFSPEEEFIEAKSFEEDIHVHLKDFRSK